MDNLRFAICIAFPGTTSSDVVKAAIHHNVHIIDKEVFDNRKDYSTYSRYDVLENGSRIFALFVFPSESILAEEESTFQEILNRLTLYSS